MVIERYESITLEEMVFMYTLYARDLELFEQTEYELTGKISNASKARVRSEKFEKCLAERKRFKCAKVGRNFKYKECGDHNKNFNNKVSANAVKIASATSCLDFPLHLRCLK